METTQQKVNTEKFGQLSKHGHAWFANYKEFNSID
jgi:hypothetical protein